MKKNQDDNNKNDRKILIGITILIMILIVAIICTTFLIKNKDDKKDTELAYTDLIKQMSDGKVEKVEMTVGCTSIKVKIKEAEKEYAAIPFSASFFTTES